MVNSMVSTSDIINKIKEIREHYDSHINNRYVKNLVMRIELSPSQSQDMGTILANEIIYVDTRGALSDLYSAMRAILVMVSKIYDDVIPGLKNYTAASGISSQEKILAQLAVKNYPSNVHFLAQKITELFEMVFTYDEDTFPSNPAYKSVKRDIIESILQFIDQEKARKL